MLIAAIVVIGVICFVAGFAGGRLWEVLGKEKRENDERMSKV